MLGSPALLCYHGTMMIRARWTLALLAVLTVACSDDPVAPEPEVSGPDVMRIIVNTDKDFAWARTIAENMHLGYPECDEIFSEDLTGTTAYGYKCFLSGSWEAPPFVHFYISGLPAPVLSMMPRLLDDGWDDCDLVRQVGDPVTYSSFECWEP